jgi:hypothetical protein
MRDHCGLPVDIQQSPVTNFCFLGTEVLHMNDRIRFITHQEKQILLVDFSHCSDVESEGTSRAVPEIVTNHPHGSVLILSDFTGAFFNPEAIRALKETAVFDKPHVRKSALVGTDSLPPEFAENLRTFSRREFPVFKTREEALAWLVKD